MQLFKNIHIDRSPDRWIYFLSCGALLVLPMGTSPFTILGVGIIAIWILSGAFIKKREDYLKAPWFLPVLALIVITWLGLIYSTDPYGLGFKFAKKSHYWLYAFAITTISFDEKSKDILINFFLAGIFVNALVGFLQLAGIVPTFSRWGAYKFTGLHGGYNTLGILLVLGTMVTSFYFRIAGTRRKKWIYASLAAVYFFHLIILEGRGGYLTLFVLLPIIVYNLTRGKKVLLKSLVFLLAIGIMLSSPILRNRITQTKKGLQNHFKAGQDVTRGKKYSEHLDRIYMWRWAIDLFLENPILGVGTGGYKQAILSKGGDKGIAHPHNNFLYMGASFGVVGLFVFGWLFWVLLKAGWKNRESPLGFFIISSTLVILVGGLTDTHMLDAGSAFLLAVTTGLLSALPGSNRQSFSGELDGTVKV